MKKIIYILGLLMMFSSCSSGFLKEYSQDLSRVKTYDDLNELLLGSGYLPLALFSNDNSYYQTANYNFMLIHFMGDELLENNKCEGNPDFVYAKTSFFPYFTWQKDTYLSYEGKDLYDSDEANPWNLAYEKIGNLNMILAEADNLTPGNTEDEAKAKKIKGEAHFLRACYYYMLVNLYGKPYAPSTASTDPAVPIKLTEYVEDKDYTRASVKDVYEQINADLDEAETNLKDITKPKSIYHAGINAVYLFRSRICLYMQDWTNAEKYAKLSLEQNKTLEAYTATVNPLNESSSENIFTMGSSMLGNVLFQTPGKTSSWNTYAPNYYISDHLYGLYEKNDSRRTSFFSTDDDKTSFLPTYRKIDYSVASTGQYKKVSDVFMFRSAEAYLNLAEAAAELGDNAMACQYLNDLRAARIAGSSSVSLSGAELVTFVREERERELCLEGHRWFDIRRYSVDAQYPYTTIIEHGFTQYKYTDGEYYRVRTDYYRLEKNDAAFVLNIPKKVREFQNSIGSNDRPDRSIVRTETYETSGGGDEE
jgi:hypothetical protein